ncbi:MAG TPA: hypothetical protein VN131_06845 [Mobilitalea sp.]|nr:hypothetical protein [Mobilitalea sp.]
MKRSGWIQRNLTTLIFIAIYLGMVLIHLFLEAFIPIVQFDLFTTMLPFIIFGVILDFILSRNNTLTKSYKMVAQIIPAGVFVLQGISTINMASGRDDIKAFNYLIWLFVVVPLFIASYQKEGHKYRMIFSLIGIGLIAVVYLYLTTITDSLDEGSGAVVYFISYFCMIYAASSIRRLPYLGTVIGAANAIALLWLRYFPFTTDAKSHGWDYDIAFSFELLIILSILACLFIRFIAVFQKDEVRTMPQEK